MKSIRAFIALEISEEVRIRIRTVIKRLNTFEIKGVNWTPIRNIHLTFKFLGDIPMEKVPRVTNSINQICENISPFIMDIKNIGVFPGFQNPRIIWAGIDKPNQVIQLQRKLELDLEKIGITPENRPFNPHLTFGRVSDRIQKSDIVKLAEVISREASCDIGSTRVDSMVLFKSDLQPSGAIYTEIARTHFSGKLQK